MRGKPNPKVKALLMQEFDKAPSCAKCDQDDLARDDKAIDDQKDSKGIHFRYCENPGSQEICQGYEDKLRHLHLICGRCGFDWIMAVNETMTDEENDPVPNVAETDEDPRDHSDDCPMCEGDKEQLSYHFCRKPGAVALCSNRVVPKEHLHMTCRCGFTYLMKTKDHVDEPETKEETKEAPAEAKKPLREVRAARND